MDFIRRDDLPYIPSMRNFISGAAFALAAMLPISGVAAMVEASLIPDGTYLVKVEKVVDSAHIQVALVHSGLESTLAATGSANFSSIKANDMLKVSIVKGQVPAFTQQ